MRITTQFLLFLFWLQLSTGIVLAGTDNESTTIEKAEQLAKSGKKDEAIALIEALTGAGNNPHLLNRLALLEKAQGRTDRAVSLLTRAISLADTSTRADLYAARAQMFREKNELQAAISDLTSAIALRPKDPQLYVLRAYLRERTGKLDLMKKDYEDCTKLCGKTAEHKVLLCHSLLHLHREQLMEREAETVIRMQPTWPLGYFFKAAALTKTGPPNAALKAIRKALAIPGLQPSDRIGLCMMLRRLKFNDEALARLNHKDLEQISTAWLYKGQILADEKRDSEAVQSFDRALSLDAHNVDAWYYRGLQCSYMSMPDKALSNLNKAHELSPDRSDINFFRAKVAFDLRKPDVALAAINTVLGKEPKNADAYRIRGQIYRYLLMQPQKGEQDLKTYRQLKGKIEPENR